MKIYISVPITGYEIDFVQDRITFAAAVLQRKGHIFISPLDICDQSWDTAKCMGTCIEALLRADAIVMLEDWKNSKGCLAERATAMYYKIPIYYGLDKVPESDLLWHIMGKEDNE